MNAFGKHWQGGARVAAHPNHSSLCSTQLPWTVPQLGCDGRLSLAYAAGGQGEGLLPKER